METQQNGVVESTVQCKSCRGGEGDGNIWVARAAESHDKQSQKCQNCQVFKSGHLFISSKGIGWTSWKKRWFILTRTSLVFFRNDPGLSTQKGGEGNLTLGGIELNNSGSVVVRADKRLLTVLFPDGRDGRTFTLKAETSEDLHEWKTALENALAQAPSAALVMGQNSIFRNDIVETVEGSLEQAKDVEPIKSTVIGRPVLLALEDIDGNPSFLEKALRFMEQHGVKIEGILRQSADCEEVKRRVEEYEQGKNEFSANEDAHLIADCIKYVLREMPSSPVPASCCTALLEAFRGDRGSRICRMRNVMSETFPEPNRRLLQRILKMMRIVASHKSENRMSISAVAACMAPLLLRPLLAGDCELDNDFTMGGDGSLQLLQAAAAANHAQAIVIILLEEYDKIFMGDYLHEDSFSSDVYSESGDASDEDDDNEEEDDDNDYDDDEDDEYEYEESTDNEIEEDGGCHDVQNDINAETEDDSRHTSSEASHESGDLDNDVGNNKALEDHDSDNTLPRADERAEANKNCHGSDSMPPKADENAEINKKPHDSENASPLQHNVKNTVSCKNSNLLPQHTGPQNNSISFEQNNISSTGLVSEPQKLSGDTTAGPTLMPVNMSLPLHDIDMIDKSNEAASTTKRPAKWGRTPAKKNLSMESVDHVSEDEATIQRLENAKNDLQSKLTREVKENELLQASLERRKQLLRERRLALQQDVERLQEQLQKERSLRAALEAGLVNMQHGLPVSPSVDKKMRADLEEIALAETDVINLNQKIADLHKQLNHKDQQAYDSRCDSNSQHHYLQHRSIKRSTSRGAKGKRANDEEKSLRKEKSLGKEKYRTSSSRRREEHGELNPTSSTEKNARLSINGDESEVTSRNGNQLPDEPSLQKKKSTIKEQSVSENTKSVVVECSLSPEESSLTKCNVVSPKFGEGAEDVSSGTSTRAGKPLTKDVTFTSMENTPALQKQFHQSASQNDTKFIAVSRSSSTEDPSFTEASIAYSNPAKGEDGLSRTTKNKKPQKQNLQSVQSGHPHKQHQRLYSQNNRTSTGVDCISSMVDASLNVTNVAQNGKKGEDALPVVAFRSGKQQAQELPYLHGSQSFLKLHEEVVSQDSRKMGNLSNSTEKTSLNGPVLPVLKCVKGESFMFGTNCEAGKSQVVESPPLRRRQPPRKLHSSLGNQMGTKPIGPCTSTSLDEPSASANASASATSRKTTARVEEVVSSSSALTRLTNRLNFLKERRVQLANEIQSMDIGRIHTPEAPPTRTNSR